MPTFRSLRHGFSSGVPPTKPNLKPPKRSTVNGWTASACRRNTRFLYGVDESRLSGQGYAVTLTVRDVPDTAKEWHAARRAFSMRLQRAGMIRMHWVIEWQRRQVPHLHLAVWFPSDKQPPDFASLWAAVAGQWGVADRGQHVTRIHDVTGWNQYTSKHAARGLSHYQRNPAFIPPGWREGSTGRMWGHMGDWPERMEMAYEMCKPAFYRLRRTMRKRAEAQARAEIACGNASVADVTALGIGEGGKRQIRRQASYAAHKRLSWARKRLKVKPMVRDKQRALSACRGCSEWLPEYEQIRLMAWLSSESHPTTGVPFSVEERMDGGDDARSRVPPASAAARARAPSATADGVMTYG